MPPFPALPALMEQTVAIITQLKMTHLLQFIKFFCCNDKEVHNRCPDLPYDIMTSSQCHHVMTTRTDIFINPLLVVGIKSHFILNNMYNAYKQLVGFRFQSRLEKFCDNSLFVLI